MMRGREAALFDDPGIYRQEFLVDHSWWCAHCHGPALFRATKDLPMKVQFVGYEHKLRCPVIEDGL